MHPDALKPIHWSFKDVFDERREEDHGPVPVRRRMLSSEAGPERLSIQAIQALMLQVVEGIVSLVLKSISVEAP